MKRIALLYGGKSGEHEISLRSAGSVFKHLDTRVYEIFLIGISLNGEWFLQSRAHYGKDGESIIVIEENPVSISPGRGLLSGGKNLHIDFVLPILHGVFGEDGTIQGALETADIPYAGSGVLGSAAGMDKCISKYLWQQQGLPIVPFTEVRTACGSNIEEAATAFGFPLFVKPARTGSSVGVKRAENMKQLNAYLEFAFQFDSKLLIEPAVFGREIECSVLGNDDPLTFPPGEILVEEGFYDYSSKYSGTGNARTVVPAELPERERSLIREYAARAFTAVEAAGFARVDFFIEHNSGTIRINEINTIPGFTSISMFPLLCSAGGVSFPRVLDRIIALGEEVFIKRKALKRIPESFA